MRPCFPGGVATTTLRRRLLVVSVVSLLAGGCGGSGTPGAPAGDAAEVRPSARSTASGAVSTPAGSPPVEPVQPAEPAQPAPPPEPSTDGRPARALLSVPALGIRDLAVVPYRGRTDDAPGTAIQDRGLAASPHGPEGGTGPGGVGNYQVTAHRLSSTRAFELLPRLRRGDRVHVVARGTRLTYRIVATRETSFRSPRSLREQRAAVPGRPGATPTRAMITLSTCATPEDHAEGNYWSDELDNPEHRIDKIGVLVAAEPAT